jgi:hypothetical protein
MAGAYKNPSTKANIMPEPKHKRKKTIPKIGNNGNNGSIGSKKLWINSEFPRDTIERNDPPNDRRISNKPGSPKKNPGISNFNPSENNFPQSSHSKDVPTFSISFHNSIKYTMCQFYFPKMGNSIEPPMNYFVSIASRGKKNKSGY